MKKTSGELSQSSQSSEITKIIQSVHNDAKRDIAKITRIYLYAVVSCISLLIIWSIIADVEEFAKASGKVVPSKSVQIVQNLEGGILAELFVAEGDFVEDGQELLRLDDTLWSSSEDELRVQERFFTAKITRLQAEANGHPFDVDDNNTDTFYDSELELYRTRQSELNTQFSILDDQIRQAELTIEELQVEVATLQQNEVLLAREHQLTERLFNRGAVTEIEFNRLSRTLNDTRGQLRSTQLSVERSESALSELVSQRRAIENDFRVTAREELATIQGQLAQVEQTLMGVSDRVSRTRVVSPVRGTVKRINISTEGGVIQPGMDLVEIVPFEDQLKVQVKVSPADIAYIYPGQPAFVRVTAYDFTIYGGLDGQVVRISPDSTEVDDQVYYLVDIITSSGLESPNGEAMPIIPGMIVEAGILTGQKSVMSYLLKPVRKTFDLALSER